ncbi:MAG: DNA-directed DNA polymerase [Candidatus Woesearchaeota archaeon]
MAIVYPFDISVQTVEKQTIVKLYCKDEQNNIVILEQPVQNFLYIEKTEKKIPYKTQAVTKTYFNKKKDLLKVFYDDALATNSVKETLQQLGITQFYEADLPFIRKFLVDRQIEPLVGYECDGKTLDSLKKTQKHLSYDKIAIMGLDIETYAKTKRIDSKNNPILMIALATKQTQVVFTHTHKIEGAIVCSNEKDMLVQTIEYIQQQNPDIICGYNSDAFDFSYIKDRCQIHGIEFTIGRQNEPLHFTQSGQAHIKGRVHLDIYPFIQRNLRTQLKTTSYSLDAVSKELVGEQKHDDVDVSKLFHAWDTKNTKQLQLFAKYNMQDAQLCIKLCDVIFPNIQVFMTMIPLPIQDITRMSYSQLVEWYLINRAQEFSVLIPPKPFGDELQKRLQTPKNVGAFVFKPKPGLYHNIAIFDFQSLYPSIIASLNIERSTIIQKGTQKQKVPEYPGELYINQTAPSFIPQVTRDIITRRVELKNQLRKETDSYKKRMLEARIYNLKILANSLYGYLAFAHARWYCNECAGATTAFARHYIKQTIERATQQGFSVIYGDTDSIFLELKDKSIAQAKEFVGEFNKSLPGIMELQLEDVFVSGIFVGAKDGSGGAKKRYALLSQSGKFKITGLEYVRTDWSDLARETQKEVIRLLLEEHDVSKATTYIKNVITKLQQKEVPVEKLFLHAKLSREVHEYETNLPHVIVAKKLLDDGEVIKKGSIIDFVVCKGSGPIYERVVPATQAKTQDVDEQYYIHNQIIPVVASIMEIFGLKKEDLVAMGKQHSLGDYFS